MARHMTMKSEGAVERHLVITIFEEGITKKQVKRETDGSFHMNTLHQESASGYEYQTQTMEYIKGDKKR